MALTQSSLKKLEGVHPHLVAIVKEAAGGPVTFQVIEGVRSLSRQRELVRQPSIIPRECLPTT